MQLTSLWEKCRTALQRRNLLRRRNVVIICAVLLAIWVAMPGIRAVTLVENLHRHQPVDPRDLPLRSVTFPAADGVQLAGWWLFAAPHAPSIILVHGFKGTRSDMLPWARFLNAAGYNVLLYDSRGCGASAGWNITLGAHEPDDVLGAVHFLDNLPDLQVHRYGALGISLGAGVVLLAATKTQELHGVVADSAWADQTNQIARLQSWSIGSLPIPQLPYAPAFVDLLIHANLAAVRPIDRIATIAPNAILFIHSADDANTLTPLADEQRLYQAANQPKSEWIVPHGGHVGALATFPALYQQKVLAFFAQTLGSPKWSSAG